MQGSHLHEPRIPRRIHHIYLSRTWSVPAGVNLTSPRSLVEHGMASKLQDTMQT